MLKTKLQWLDYLLALNLSSIAGDSENDVRYYVFSLTKIPGASFPIFVLLFSTSPAIVCRHTIFVFLTLAKNLQSLSAISFRSIVRWIVKKWQSFRRTLAGVIIRYCWCCSQVAQCCGVPTSEGWCRLGVKYRGSRKSWRYCVECYGAGHFWQRCH